MAGSDDKIPESGSRSIINFFKKRFPGGKSARSDDKLPESGSRSIINFFKKRFSGVMPL